MFIFLSNSAYCESGDFINPPQNFLKVKNAPYKISLEKKLNKKISAHFDNTHIRDILQYIATISELNIILDETPLTNDDENKFKLTMHFDDIPVRKILWYICNETDLYAYFDEDISPTIPGPIIITSKDIAKKFTKIEK